MSDDTRDWRQSAGGLADELAAAGVLSPDWRSAFAEVPRHVFVPRFVADGRVVDRADPARRAEWFRRVYSDETLVVQERQVPGTTLMWSTNSSTRPSLMARMLGLLDVRDGQRVAEIGTGTGYNVALLSHRLGDANVASIDIDPVLVETARERLAGVGYAPYLTTGDGADGIPARAPHDRLIATCAVSRVPPAWIRQLTADGVVLADLRGEVASSLLVARKIDADTVQGRFLTTPGDFMWLRARADNPLRDGGTFPTIQSREHRHTTLTTLDPAEFGDPDLRFLLQLRVPDLQPFSTDTDVVGLWTIAGGWADITKAPTAGGRHHVTYGGPDLLWQTVEATTELWHRIGRPARNRFGLTAGADGTHRYWLDTPTQVVV